MLQVETKRRASWPKGFQEGLKSCQIAVQEHLHCKRARTSNFHDPTTLFKGLERSGRATGGHLDPTWSAKWAVRVHLESTWSAKWAIRGHLESTWTAKWPVRGHLSPLGPPSGQAEAPSCVQERPSGRSVRFLRRSARREPGTSHGHFS